MESVHENNKSFKCEICEYSCSSKGRMKIQVEAVQETIDANVTFVASGYSYSQKGTTKRHGARVHDSKTKQHKKVTKKDILL